MTVRLHAGYGKKVLLQDLRFELFAGDRLGLLPRRGGWAQGEVTLDGVNLLALSGGKARQLRNRALALVPQSPQSALNPHVTLQRHFEHAWHAHRERNGPELRRRVEELFARVRLPADEAFLKRKPGQISVGQAQRCVLALALLHRPSVIIADEPTSSLDPAAQTEVLELFRETSEEHGAALLFVSHDLLSVLRLCTEVAILADGRIAEQLPVTDIVDARTPTLRQLLGALPVPAEILIRHLHPKTASPSTSTTSQARIPQLV